MDSSIQVMSRAISILQYINRTGGATLTAISRDLRLPYVTGLRIVQTLEHEGLIYRSWKTWKPAEQVKSLSCGFQFNDPLVERMRPHLVDMTRETGWPATLATRSSGRLFMRDTTHDLAESRFGTFYPGYPLKAAHSASGLAYLSACDPQARDELLADRSLKKSRPSRATSPDAAVLESVRQDGYAFWEGGRAGVRSATIAVPVRAGDELVGSLAITYEPETTDRVTAAERYVPLLQEVARATAQA